MGNTPSNVEPAPAANTNRRSTKKASDNGQSTDTEEDDTNNLNQSSNSNVDVMERAQKALGVNLREWQSGIASRVRKLEEQDHPAAALIDSVCGPILDPRSSNSGKGSSNHNGKNSKSSSSRRSKRGPVQSYYSEDVESEDDSRTVSEDETTTATDYVESQEQGGRGGRGGRKGRNNDDQTEESASYVSQSDFESTNDDGGQARSKQRKSGRGKNTVESSYETEDDETTQGDTVTASGGVSFLKDKLSYHHGSSALSKQPLASSFAKRCYFTKAGIGGMTQHYEGLTLTGNVVLMLAAAMKLKGCPTICDEDLRRVEQTYPNQFSRLPDELLLSSGWRRISKFCHFSNKPIPDGVPFFRTFKLSLLLLLGNYSVFAL